MSLKFGFISEVDDVAKRKEIDFPIRFRGYDPEMVDDEMDRLNKEMLTMRSRQQKMEEEVKKLREENKILNHRIQIHEKANEEIARLALKEASELIEKAKRNANLILKESLDYVRTLSGEVEGFKEQAATFRASVQKMSQDLLDTIDNSEVYYLINEGKSPNAKHANLMVDNDEDIVTRKN